MTPIRYKAGYKYQLAEDYTLKTSIRPERFILTQFIRLDTDGTLHILAGYAWDGPSGPTIDSKNFMRGSLVHDALYQLMREGHLDPGRWRKPADELLVAICKEDGMWGIRRWWVYAGVRLGAAPATQPRLDEVLSAP